MTKVAGLTIRPPDECRYDAVALGEVMLRLDPGEGRIRTARSFRVWEGGGEYNVARGLRRTFGMRAALVTALADNEVGRLLEDLILTGGVDTSWIRWVPYDGIGQGARNGLNFTERGFGVRGAIGMSDRGHTAVSQLAADQVDWDALFGEAGVRWFHTGGIFAGLSDLTSQTALAAVRAAKRNGAVVSYDLNYRASLWQDRGGMERAREVNATILPHADVVFGIDGAGRGAADLSEVELTDAIRAFGLAHPNLSVIASPLRRVVSATRNDWGGVAWSRSTGLVRAAQRDGLEILDRVGGGDSFASGMIVALLEGLPLATAVEYGAAHGALAMTTPGDTSMASRAEVVRLAARGESAVDR